MYSLHRDSLLPIKLILEFVEPFAVTLCMTLTNAK